MTSVEQMPATETLADPYRWTLTILPLPKRQRSARAFGFCGGFAVGHSEGTGLRTVPHWWPGGVAHQIELVGQKRLEIRSASGTVVPGFWRRSTGQYGGAIGFRLEAGSLVPIDLHPKNGWEWTAALGAGGAALAGYGQPRAKKGETAAERALAWRADSRLVELPPGTPGDEAMGHATDGAFVVGRSGETGRQQAALWAADGSSVVLLGDGRSISEAHGVADGEQVGVKWTGLRNAPALWRGTAGSYVDLTPSGHEVGWASGCARGYQVGFVKVKDNTRSGGASLANRAALWGGDAGSFVDLHACVPEPWNASEASAVEIVGRRIRICGAVVQFGVEHELTPRESQYVTAERAALWEAEIA